MRRRRWIGAVLAAAMALLTGGCGLGYTPEPPSADLTSATAQAGSITVSDAFLSSSGGSHYNAGSTAVAEFTLQDSGATWDTLTSATSTAAGSVRLLSLDEPEKQISVPSGSSTVDASCQLIDLNEQLTPGQRVPLTLQFSGAGAITLDVPVH